MRRNITLLLTTVLTFSVLARPIFAQKSASSGVGISELEGIWILDPGKSHFGKVGQNDYKGYTKEISVIGDEVRIRTISGFTNEYLGREIVLFADGRGELNDNIKSVTRWKKGRLVRRFSEKVSWGWQDHVYQYHLSKDGNTLIFEFETKSAMPFTNDAFSLVFNRKI